MLKFFRHIRQQLLKDNRPDPGINSGKFSKYLLYAIGEVLLVVIGILIALQVNNWNNNAKDREKESYYLQSIKTSIALSQNELQRVIGDAELISSCADTLLILLSHQRYNVLEGVFLDSLLFSAGDYSRISLNDGGIREILNTGSLGIIRDEVIRVSLASWDEHIHKIRKYEEETEYVSRKYSQFLDAYIDESLFILDAPSAVIPEKKEALLRNPMLRNYLRRISVIHSGMHRRYTAEKKSLDSLAIMIDSYLIK